MEGTSIAREAEKVKEKKTSMDEEEWNLPDSEEEKRSRARDYKARRIGRGRG